MGVKYVFKNVTRKHNFLAPIIFLEEKLDLCLKRTEEKSMRKWAHIWFIVDKSDLIVFKCCNLFSSQAQWSIVKYMKVTLTYGLFYNFIVSLLIIKNIISHWLIKFGIKIRNHVQNGYSNRPYHHRVNIYYHILKYTASF